MDLTISDWEMTQLTDDLDDGRPFAMLQKAKVINDQMPIQTVSDKVIM